MSCPDWRALTHLREGCDEPAGWSDAVAHFDSGCADCRRAALTAEPTLIFRRLRTSGAAEMSPSQEASEADAVRQAVAAMRTASRVDAIERRGAAWKRWAVAAGLLLASLSLLPGDSSHKAAQLAPASPLSLTRSLAATSVMPAALTGDDLPTVEGVNRPGARVYHMDGDGMSVVMIVDESLDV